VLINSIERIDDTRKIPKSQTETIKLLIEVAMVFPYALFDLYNLPLGVFFEDFG
jgi:hypothetical protein